MINALSSESPLTIVLIVEYSIGLSIPFVPRRYQATKLFKEYQHQLRPTNESGR